MQAEVFIQREYHAEKSKATESQQLRHDARTHLEQGAVIADNAADRSDLLKQLNQALATELVCALRYRRHCFMARGIHARIVQLGGEPDFAPQQLDTRSHTEYVAADSPQDMIREDLVAERIAIHSYRATIQSIGDKGPTTSDSLNRELAHTAT